MMQNDGKYSLSTNDTPQAPTCPTTEANYNHAQQQISGYTSIPQPTPPAYVAPDSFSQPNAGFGQFPQQQYTSIGTQPNSYSTHPSANSNVITSQPSTFLFNTTTVITTQPLRQWRYKLSDCCTNCNVCCSVCFCRVCVECGIAKRMNENGCIACCPGGVALLRAKYRTTHYIEGTLMDDACKSIWCQQCVLCQMANDMNAEGYSKECCGCC